MENQDIRWKQRFANYEKAIIKLFEAIKETEKSENNLLKEGTIQRFEFTHELAWKVMKDYLNYEGMRDINGSRGATREAFNKDMISDGETWMDMIETRNKTVHTYDDKILDEEYFKITTIFFPLLIDFEKKMQTYL